MSSDDFLRNLLPSATNASQIVVSEVQPDNAQTEKVEIAHPFSEVSTGIIILSGLFCVFMFSKTWATAREDLDDLLAELSSQIPCRRCCFFSNNLYLKCAIQPTIAMTKEAIDCSDFRPRTR